MSKLVITFSRLTLVILFLSACTHAVDTRKDRTSNDAKNTFVQRTMLSDEELIVKAKDEGMVRIIIRLNMEFKPEGKLGNPESILTQRRKISELQLELINILEPYKISRVKRSRYAPSLAMAVNEQAMKVLLEQSHLVRYIELDLLRRLHLSGSRLVTGARRAAELGYRGGGWAIAILDSGVDTTHDFLLNKVVGEACFSDNLCPNGATEEHGSGAGINCPTSITGCDHGTHVAGIAAGWGGIAQHASIISIQVFSREDSVETCESYDDVAPCLLTRDSVLASALDWVHGHTYNVFGLPVATPSYSVAAVNMSLGWERFTTPCTDSVMKDHIDNLRSIGVATVISSGNNGYPDSLSFPACISSAISVGATTKTGGIWESSNRSDFMSLWAPGVSIESSTPGGSLNFKMVHPWLPRKWPVLSPFSKGPRQTNTLTI